MFNNKITTELHDKNHSTTDQITKMHEIHIMRQSAISQNCNYTYLLLTLSH